MSSLQAEGPLDPVLPAQQEVGLSLLSLPSRHSAASPSFASQPKIECATCKKWFISEAKKQEHLALHEKCPYPGCTFAAIEKVLRDHIAAQHKTGEDKLPPSLLELIPEK